MSGFNNIPAVTVEQFLEQLPAFSQDTSKYPQASIASYLLLGTNSLDPNRWQQMLTMGICWYTAHFLTLDAQDAQDAEAGAIMGQRGGQVASKGVGGGNMSYDTSGAIEPGGGHWNLTSFGKRYLRFARLAGAGPVQVSGGCWPGRPFGVLTGQIGGQ
jgi:hypothetical protein